MRRLDDIAAAVAPSGLTTHGGFSLDDDDRKSGLAGVATIVLLGLDGRRGWAAFAASPDAQDSGADPLDRWSRRVIDALAAELGARPLFPFGGPPHWPFQRWAMRAEPMSASPLGLLIHQVAGLWRGYRGALAFAAPLDLPGRVAAPSPCDACVERPCLSACPVGAFSGAGYDVAACAAHLRSAAGRACMERGCLARRACPVGADHAHARDQAAFHMRAFVASRNEA